MPMPIDFSRHWQTLRASFERDAPALIARYFGTVAGGELPLLERVVLDGKAARGCLVLLVCEALGGTHADAMSRAVLIECVQAATLVHDDVIDGDTLRRNRPALWTSLGARRAILLGDLMFATSLMQAARLGHADVTALAEAIGTVASGAYREPLHASEVAAKAAASRVSLYERVIHCKTGALFGAAGRLGAIAAQASDASAKAACAFATRVGEAYQMADDMEDLLGREAHAQDAQKLAALAALREHFARRRAHEALRPQLTREIHRRIGLARREVHELAQGAPAALLHAAPHFIINLQTTLDG